MTKIQKQIIDEAKKLDAKTLEWIKSELLNNEAASNDEMMKYFIREGKMSPELTLFFIMQRSAALKDYRTFELKLPTKPLKEKTAKERYADQSGTRLTENDIFNILYSLPFTFVGEVMMNNAPISFNQYIKNHY